MGYRVTTLEKRGGEEIMNIKKILVGAVATGLMLSSFAGAALAAGPGYNPPPAVDDVCNAGHGAFAAFSDPNLHWTPGPTTILW